MPDPALLEEYNSEPIFYCSKCYSLRIKYEDAIDSDCCMDCGCSDIKEANIDTWSKLYEERYGHKYVSKNRDVFSHPIYKLSLSELKSRIYHSALWRQIIYKLYPSFPRYYGKADSVILFFDKLIKDDRIKDLKLLLIDLFNKHKIKYKY